MIQLQDFAIRRGGRLLFDQASMQLHPGWKIGLTGVNGAGKSTLFAALLGEVTGDAGTLSRPSVWTVAHMAQEVETQETAALDFVLSGDEEWWEINQAIEQDDPNMPIERLTDLHGRFGEIDGYTAPARAAQMMAGLGFSDAQLVLPVSSFSGGWRMRLNLARTLMSRSDLLLLDEPTNHLDLDAILWLEDWLKQYAGTLVLISHDRDFLDAITDHILHVENQKLTLYTGNYSTFEQTRAERLAQQQQAFEKQQATRAHLQKYIDRFKAQATKARQAQSRIKQLERMQDLSAAHIDTPFTFSFREPTRMSTPLLRLDEVDAGYGDKAIVQNIVLQLTPDSRIGLLGMNGAGKSTLIKTLTGVLPTLKGQREASEHLNLGYFAQHQMDELDGDASPMLAISRLAGRQVSDADLRAFLGSFGFSGQRMDEPCAGFSGGERARLALALIVWKKPNVLILDEPTNHLDLDMRLALSMALQDFEGAVVLVSHERQLIAAVCDELFVVHDGSCTPFAGDLSDYATWLRQARQDIDQKARQAKLEAKQQKPAATPPVKPVAVVVSEAAPEPKPVLDKEQARKQAAALREQTRPLRQQMEKLEAANQKAQQRLAAMEIELADSSLYDAARKADLLKLMNEQQQLRNECEQRDEQLLELMMQLDEMQAM
ncbi:MAG: ATP-binding cassette domain-containing protein [Pseudomonadota bacterium]|nr:ATP-binding cassette domain-containing protein [Pseudomonadota bacterium]